MNNKILFILHLPPPIHGSSMVGQFIKESKLINRQYDGDYINLGTSIAINEIGKHPVRKINLYLKIVGAVLKKLTTSNFEIVYIGITAKGIGFYKDFIIALIAKFSGGTLLLHFHNKGVATNQNRFIDDLLYRVLFRHAKVMLLSPLLYEDIKKYVKPVDVFYCPNGIPESYANKNIKLSKNTTVNLLFFSNLIESKGVYELLEACSYLQQKQIPFSCTFAGGEGDITASNFSKRVKQLNLENHVQYIGKQYGEEKKNVFEKADIFVLPSYNDCFPLVLIEAMKYGLPIVSTYEGGIPDLVDEGITGYLVRQQDSINLAKQIELMIINSELRAKMGTAAKAKFDKEYTLEKFENRFVDILNKVCEN